MSEGRSDVFAAGTDRREGIRATGDALLDDIDVAVYAVDAAGLCVRFNPAAERLLGDSQSEALGRDMHELVHYKWPDGRPFAAADCPILQARSAQSAVHGIEEVLWAKDGSAIPVRCSAASAMMHDGSLGTMVTLKDMRGQIVAEGTLRNMEVQAEALRQRDATARVERELATEGASRQREVQAELERAAAAQLRAQQDLLGTVAETAPVGIAVFDREMRYRWMNDSYLQSMDPAYRGRKLRGVSFFDVVAPGNLSEIRAIVEGVQQTGKTYTAEAYSLEGVQRGITYWRWSLSRLENGDLMSTGAEVTEQVNARAEVEAVYANAPIGLSLLDAKTLTYVRVNRQYADMVGTAQKTMLGATFAEFVSSAEAELLLKKAARGETTRNCLLQMKVVSDPEAERYFLLNATPNLAHFDEGEVVSVSVAITEVTTQKRAENALVQADKLAAVGRLAASISHEINNPLEAVTNLLYLVHQDEHLSAQSAEYVSMAEAELARVSQIASQTLRFHRHALKPVSLTPKQVVDPVVALYQGRLKNTRVKVLVEHRGSGDPMVVFEGDVRQILSNLLGNAIDAMPGGGTITVRTHSGRSTRTDRPGTRISISDSGHGMSAETAAHIFEPFFTTKGSGGSGLGLWISHTLANRHGGSLCVRSRLLTDAASGKGGTVFSLFLPNLDAVPGA